MKLSKKSITVLSFTVGACLFVSTAFADALLGSGYDRLKDSVKNTASVMENGLNNYTVETMYTLKDNNQILLQSSNFMKMDTVNQVKEDNEVTKNAKGETTSRYSYADKTQTIDKNELDNTYYVFDHSAEVNQNRKGPADFHNPFKEKGATEVEKIVDAVVGSLKDYVQVEEGANGGKVFSGSLSESQVPAIVNAVSSFGIKQMLDNERDLPAIESDIFVKKVVGTANESKDGYLENLTGEITLSGKDKNGVQHDLNLNVMLKLSEIGSTKITKPDLTTAKVEKVSRSGGFSSKYVGTYQNDIIMDKDGKFVKIGDRTVKITSVDGDKVTGTYSETVKPGFESEYPSKDVFNFEYNLSTSPTFTYTDSKGEQKQGMIHPSMAGKIYFEMNLEISDKNAYKQSNSMKPFYDGEFNRVFE
ncbi:hypothetical protein PAECIP111891_02586 [Paenibacillus allorhizoplanae]|uniref:DUF4179 domain-containing protein n=1 Tax=Paenibacillus allorhizoplanae TaxID=2905648 RepID=A0ABN8GHK1_9BACL|nr:hypothetical protein [Paenibacillus allorhizoplanae]CAH1204711.1 hypothetical protein PAECIP111891_02586 [Paenibacillus allorhizoplanae]